MEALPTQWETCAKLKISCSWWRFRFSDATEREEQQFPLGFHSRFKDLDDDAGDTHVDI